MTDSLMELASRSRGLRIARAGLALVCFGVEAGLSGRPGSPLSLGCAAYAVFALGAVARRSPSGSAPGLLALFLDTVFFLVFAEYGAERTLWLAAALYLYVLARALARFGPTEVATVALVSILVILAGGAGPLLQTVVVAGALATAGAIWKRRMDRQTDSAIQEARKARAEAAQATDAERQRIAADFHDGPLQSFISFQIRLDVLRRLLERDVAAGLQDLRQLQELSQTQVRDLRAFVRRMRPVDAGASLTAAIRRLVDEFQKETGIAATFTATEKPVPIAPEISTDVLQIVREALHNVQKHSGATRVGVTLEHPGKLVEISIDDNGAGFPFSGLYTLDELDLLRLGPVSIKRRSRTIGAELTLESHPGRGAGLKFKVPL